MIKIIGEFSGSIDERAEFTLTFSEVAIKNIVEIQSFISKSEYAVSAEAVVPALAVKFDTKYVHVNDIDRLIFTVDDIYIELTAVLLRGVSYVEVSAPPFYLEKTNE